MIRHVLLLATLLVSCAGQKIMVNGVEVYEGYWENAKDEIAALATKESGCSTFAFQLIRRSGNRPSEVIAVGCGRAMTYTRGRTDFGTNRGDWTLEGSGAQFH